MSELAYMVREDWGQHGTAMEPQSAVIREWIGEAPYLFAVADSKRFSRDDRDADLEAAEFVAPEGATRIVFNIRELGTLKSEGKVIDHAVVALHPLKQAELETIREAVEAGSVRRLFVLIWSPRDLVRIWLDGSGALNLHTGEPMIAPDPLMVEAGRMMIDHQYNGLSSGQGKDAVVQLVRAFSSGGYPIDVNAWLRAYFAAGGTFHHAESIEKLIKEMKAGTKHRVKPHYRENILEIIEERVRDGSSVES
ncbi:hypothetical protein [Mycetocola zhujimingii]|uniref:Uncharacterized protein n=1 Tax=Mycetocola zhujimingii TaxID=2079792 RepID=A0A2U1TCQ7_9MICO|nr:hypothetical protein [Mycetocola zhujimingii]PWC06664.1 hypothetical protein DF223_10405 [Mycetocola zhujimingii]